MAHAYPANGVCLSYNLLLLPHQLFAATRHPLPAPDGAAEQEEEPATSSQETTRHHVPALSAPDGGAEQEEEPATFPQETTRHHLPALPAPDGGEEEEDEEAEDEEDDDEDNYFIVDEMTFLARVGCEGLPKELVERFMKITLTDETAAAYDDVCTVCLDDMHQQDREIGVLGCHHAFHADCIGEWLLFKNVCPLCRAIVLDIY